MVRSYLFAMFLTAGIETLGMWCCGYRQRRVLSYFFGLNLISNLAVNWFYQHTQLDIPDEWLVFSLETAVVLFEAAALGLMTGYNRKMLTCVLITNLLSFGCGKIIFGF
ncbi:MAG: hypothetical protein J6Y91_04305 [Alphaproteobacteria bacterium]|nr:hypothetical protein [Alphaproteobacteria bacterium]